MQVTTPTSLDDALNTLAEHPETVALAGGTDLMVAVNFGRERPGRVMSLRRLADLAELRLEDGRVRCGAGVTFTRMLDELPDQAVVQAARTVGSPQIRNAGTLGGNIATCSPAGDTLPVLAALDAVVVLRSKQGERRVRFAEFMTGPKKNIRRADELIVGAEWDDAGPAQTFMKVGTRNAMVIAIAGLALVVDRSRRRVGVGLGSCGPTILRAPQAEAFAAAIFEAHGWDRHLTPSDAELKEFGRLVATAARPIDDVRGTAAYRRHVLAVMGERALARVWSIT